MQVLISRCTLSRLDLTQHDPGEPVVFQVWTILEMDIEEIRRRVLDGHYSISFTHTEKLRRRQISIETIEIAICHGEIIEDYPNDPRGASCLIYGAIGDGRPIHVVCGTIQPDHIVIITVYEPNTKEWERDWRTRKKGGER